MGLHRHAEGAVGTSQASDRRLLLALGLSATYMIGEVVGGVAANSLALLADAGHMFGDVAALGLAYAAGRLMRRPATSRRTYGYYRAEILAALANGASLVAISLFVSVQAVGRLYHPTRVDGPLMMGVAAGGLAVNVAVLAVLRRDRERSLNHRGAWIHALSDALGSVQVILAGGGVLLWGWSWLDPVASLLVSALIVKSAWNLTRESVSVLFESAPAHLDVDEVLRALQDVAGVRSVHDLHVWTIGNGLDALSVHVRSDCLRPRDDLLRDLQGVLRERFGLQHSTVQIEDEPCEWVDPHR